MRKLRLDVEQLTVDSFVPQDGRFARGTVHGQSGDTFACETGSGNTCDNVTPCSVCNDDGTGSNCGCSFGCSDNGQCPSGVCG